MNSELEGVGISLLEKGRKGVISAVFSRFGLIVILLLLQVGILIGIFRWFGDFLPHIYGLTIVLAFSMIVYLLNSRMDPTAKLTWLVVIMLMPFFGALLFLFVQSDLGHRALKRRVKNTIEESREMIPYMPETMKKLQEENPNVASLAKYIDRTGCFPVYDDTKVTYFPLGEDKFDAMLRQLDQAKDFIFLEYFIIDEGVMWGHVLEILAEKAAAGVDVRVMYDGTCEFSLLSHDYPQRLEKLGIKCKMFAPVQPFVSTHYNYRDHRKILVIDGKVAFNGGINLADEYINRKERFGHWKDTAVMLEGEAARSFALMFLQMWSLGEKYPEYTPYLDAPVHFEHEPKGFVIPYGDCPVDDEKVGKQVYMDILNRAQEYVHFMTPYLILDGDMENAIKFAAERGVDVRIILPGIPDKEIPYALAWTHYRSLLDSGVKLYEYTPGFVHAKVAVSDGREAVVGTINLDYRSLYHHFECATYMYKVDCISDIEADFQATQAKCRTVTYEAIKNESLKRKVTGIMMKLIAPLM